MDDLTAAQGAWTQGRQDRLPAAGCGHVDAAGIGAILLDIDNTLYEYATAHAQGLAAATAAFGAACPGRLDDAAFAETYRACRTAVTGRLRGQGACRSRFLAFQMLLEGVGVPAAYALAARLEELYWDAFIRAMTPNRDLIDWLRRRHAEGIPICAVTNMQAVLQVRKLDRLGVTDIVAFMVTSEEIGREKPDPAMFEAALAKLGTAPSRALMLGDSQTDDIEGARRAGIQACRITSYT